MLHSIPKLLWISLGLGAVVAATQIDRSIIFEGTQHLRSGDEREFSRFEENADAEHFYSEFDAKANDQEYTLLVRHESVRNSWNVSINNRKLGALERHEGNMTSYWSIPKKVLKDGKNSISIKTTSTYSDDVFVGSIEIVQLPASELLQAAKVSVTVKDKHNKKNIPSRLTITETKNDSLVPLGVVTTTNLAVRTGVIYTADGTAEFGLQPGSYKVTASRGFEYSIDVAEFEIKKGDSKSIELNLVREVPTPNLVSCDTHIHTRTYSGHGDCRVEERVITIAGEGIEFAVSTDHNHHADYEPFAKTAKTRKYFTPVIGNEFTTKVGHVNIFPVDKTKKPADASIKNWPALMKEIKKHGEVRAAVLNHPRNAHGGLNNTKFQPFGPEHFHSQSGEQLDGWPIEFDGIEVVVSSALQSDYDLVYRDWFSLLNRGIRVSPLGSCDSHDVNRYILGQGRTYVRANDADPSKVDVEEVCKSLKEGNVYVSMGLLTEITVNEKFLPGDTVKATGELSVIAKIRGPGWVTADRVRLFDSGIAIIDEVIKPQARKTDDPSLIAEYHWTIPKPKHDTYLVLHATGPGVKQPFWRIPYPYQKNG